MLKTNHDGGGVVLVPDKDAFLADSKTFKQAMKKLNKHLNTNYYTMYREWHYKDIEPRVFAEELLGVESSTQTNLDSQKFENGGFHKELIGLKDYRFHCFNSHTEFIQVADHTHTHNNFFTTRWQELAITYLNKPSKETISKPHNLAIMLSIATKLAHSLCSYIYVRIDLYCTFNQVYVGELTFTPNGGTGRFTPQEWDKKFGELWNSAKA